MNNDWNIGKSTAFNHHQLFVVRRLKLGVVVHEGILDKTGVFGPPGLVYHLSPDPGYVTSEPYREADWLSSTEQVPLNADYGLARQRLNFALKNARYFLPTSSCQHFVSFVLENKTKSWQMRIAFGLALVAAGIATYRNLTSNKKRQLKQSQRSIVF